jgi:hypothetical protein
MGAGGARTLLADSGSFYSGARFQGVGWTSGRARPGGKGGFCNGAPHSIGALPRCSPVGASLIGGLTLTSATRLARRLHFISQAWDQGSYAAFNEATYTLIDAAPEPVSLLLFGSGCLALTTLRRRA